MIFIYVYLTGMSFSLAVCGYYDLDADETMSVALLWPIVFFLGIPYTVGKWISEKVKK